MISELIDLSSVRRSLENKKNADCGLPKNQILTQQAMWCTDTQDSVLYAMYGTLPLGSIGILGFLCSFLFRSHDLAKKQVDFQNPSLYLIMVLPIMFRRNVKKFIRKSTSGRRPHRILLVMRRASSSTAYQRISALKHSLLQRFRNSNHVVVRVLRNVNSVSHRHPAMLAACTSCVRCALADVVLAQYLVEGRDFKDFNWTRVTLFSIYGALYVGLVQVS